MSSIPFDYPSHLLAEVAAKNVLRFGTILKDSATGKIVGHMQETGIAQSLLSSAISGAPTPLSFVTNMVNMGSGIYTSIQVGQLKIMMAALQTLQIATLGVSLVGVGVSIAGFLYMKKRFTLLDGRIDKLMETINIGFENQRMADLRVHMSRTKGLLQRAGQVHALSNSHSGYMEVSAGLSEQAAYFEGEINFMASARSPINLEIFWQLVQMLILCNSARIDCQVRCNELLYALRISESVASDYQDIFNRLTPVSFDKDIKQGLATINVLRDVTDSAQSKPYLIDFLRTRRINGNEYFESLEKEKESPFLILKTY